MAPKTTKRKPTLKFGTTDSSSKVQIKFPAEWEKRITEVEQALKQGGSGVVYLDNVTTGQPWAQTDRVAPKGTIQELAYEINLESNRVKQLAIDVKHNMIAKLGDLPPHETKSNDKDNAGTLPPIEIELRAVKSELAQIYSILSYINDLQEVKL